VHGRRAPVEYVLDCLANNTLITGPLSPAMSRVGQQITDSAALAAELRRTVELLP